MSDARAFPTVRAYLDWAAGQGCAIAISPLEGGDQLAQITRPDGRYVFEVFADADDALTSSNIARLDRRLGLKSYLFV